MQSEAHKDIEEHFSSIFQALEERKHQLIRHVDKLSLEIRKYLLLSLLLLLLM